MAAAALPLALSPLGGGEGGGDTTPPTKIQRGPPGCCSPTERRRRRPRSGPRPLRRTLTAGAANFPLFFGREDPHPIRGDPPSSHSGSPPAPPLPAPLPPRIRQCKSSQSQQAGPHPARPRGLGAAVSPFPSTDPPMPSRQRGPPPAAHGGGGAALAPSPKYPGCSSPPRPPSRWREEEGPAGGAAGNLPPSPGANRPMQTLPELQRRRAAPTSSARLRRADPRGARGCSADRPPPGLSLHFSPPPPVRDQLSASLEERGAGIVGEGRGTAGILPVRKCPPPGSGWEERYPRAGGCGRHGHLRAPGASMLGKLPPAEPLPRTRGSHGARSAPRPSAARLPLPRVTLPRAQVKRSEMHRRIHCAGCLDCPSAESSLCARGL